jgi:hypothetical protein
MRRCLSNNLIFGNCFCILSGLLLADPEGDDLEQSKVLKLSIFGMKLHRSSSKVHRNCLTLLRIATTSYHDDDDDEESFLLNHIEIIMQALESYCTDGDLQAEGCGILGNTISSSTTANVGGWMYWKCRELPSQAQEQCPRTTGMLQGSNGVLTIVVCLQ